MSVESQLLLYTRAIAACAEKGVAPISIDVVMIRYADVLLHEDAYFAMFPGDEPVSVNAEGCAFFEKREGAVRWRTNRMEVEEMEELEAIEARETHDACEIPEGAPF